MGACHVLVSFCTACCTSVFGDLSSVHHAYAVACLRVCDFQPVRGGLVGKLFQLTDMTSQRITTASKHSPRSATVSDMTFMHCTSFAASKQMMRTAFFVLLVDKLGRYDQRISVGKELYLLEVCGSGLWCIGAVTVVSTLHHFALFQLHCTQSPALYTKQMTHFSRSRCAQ